MLRRTKELTKTGVFFNELKRGEQCIEGQLNCIDEGKSVIGYDCATEYILVL